MNIFVKCVISICLALMASVAFANDYLVVPGQCIGNVCIGESSKNVSKQLGPSSSTRHLQGVTVRYWHSSAGDALFVVLKHGVVSEIHVSSASFKTSDGIGASSTYSEVVHAFPAGKEDCYALFSNSHNRCDWEVKASGITFTFAGDSTGQMVRLVVHNIGQSKTIGFSQHNDWYWYPQ